MKRILLLIAALTLSLGAIADEGMWLLPLIQQMNKKDLKAAGCKLTPQEIYNINKSSLKDAIVQFGGGCTGEMISDRGLLVTNHHCGYSSIQGLSTDDHNYLMEGYWANELAEEIPVPGLSVTFLVSMEDVTATMEAAEDKEAARRGLIDEGGKANPGCRVTVTGFYNENIFYRIVYRTYTDVRFVGDINFFARHFELSSTDCILRFWQRIQKCLYLKFETRYRRYEKIIHHFADAGRGLRCHAVFLQERQNRRCIISRGIVGQD